VLGAVMKKTMFMILVIFSIFSSLIAMKQKEENNSKNYFEVWFNFERKQYDFALGEKFFKYSHSNNKNLINKDRDCFNPSFIKNIEKSTKKLEELGGKYISVESKNHKKIHCTFINRKSGTLLVFGPGFPVARQKMLTFIKLFSIPKYDLLLFDYPGIGAEHSIGKSSYFLPWKWKGFLSWLIGKVDFNASALGATEEEEVITVVNYFKKKNKYKKVYGLGVCFSAYVFAKVICKRPDLFDKLILDGVWLSVERVVRTIAKNPSLICSSENPRSPVAYLTRRDWFQSVSVNMLEWLAWTKIKTPSMVSYLSELKCPVLFFQCLNDCYCSNDEFLKIWDGIKGEKTACFTKNSHGRNHVKQPKVYKEIANKFFELSGNDFLNFLQGNAMKSRNAKI
jgi:hypothetical protein